MVISALIMGIFLGILLQRGRVCFNSAFRDIVLMKDNYLFKILAFYLALTTISFHFIAQLGIIQLNPMEFNLLLNISGAYIFGIGMVVAGGCGSGIFYRIGEGMTTAMISAIGFGLTAFATREGILSFFLDRFTKYNLTTENNNSIYAEITGINISSILGINPWIPAIIFSGVLILYVFGTKTTARSSPIDWRILSVFLSIVSTLGYIFSYSSGRNYSFGITSSSIELLKGYLLGDSLRWNSISLIGIIFGSFLSAIKNKEFKLRMPRRPSAFIQALLGGCIMGFGASMAFACNIGHFFSGVPMLGLSSIVASIFLY